MIEDIETEVEGLDASFQRVVKAINTDLLSESEKVQFIKLIGRIPLTNDIEFDRVEHVNLGQELYKYHFITRERVRELEVTLVNVKKEVVDKAEAGSTKRLTVDQKETLLATHPDSAGVKAKVDQGNNLLDAFKELTTLFKSRETMLSERSYADRQDRKFS